MATYTPNLNLKKPSTGEKYDVVADLNDSKDKIDVAIGNHTLNVKKFGAKGDGVTDDTLSIQSAIDSLANGNCLLFPKGIYKVSKNVDLLDFPNNDQPCLVVRGKSDIEIRGHGAIFKTDVHAQGIFEFQLSENVIAKGLRVKGLGLFPGLDGATGRGEKGSSTEGYHTSGYWGYYKNNSYDSSASTTGGNVPKPWGKFNNGYIGNVAYGILVHNGCKNITFKNCEVEGFNYSGFGVGHIGDYILSNLGYEESTNILFDHCHSHDNYSANFQFTDADQVTIANDTLSERAGHPNSNKLTDANFDPGYGICTLGIENVIAKNVNIKDSVFKDCVRKGIDSHASINFTAKNNKVTSCYAGGIYGAWSSPIQPTVNFSAIDNIIENCGMGVFGAIFYQGCIDAEYSLNNIKANAQFIANKILNCGGGGNAIVTIKSFDNVTFNDNTIDGIQADELKTDLIAMLIGKSGGANNSYNLTMNDNHIIDNTGKIRYGMQIDNVMNGGVDGNIINLKNTKNTLSAAGLYPRSCGDVNFINNYVKIGAIGTPLALAQTTGVVNQNIGLGGNAPNSIPLNKNTVASYNSVSANNFVTRNEIAINDDSFIDLGVVKNQFIGLINDNSGKWILFTSINENTIGMMSNLTFNALGSTTPTGTSGTDGVSTVCKQNGKLFIENRTGSVKTYSLTILG